MEPRAKNFLAELGRLLIEAEIERQRETAPPAPPAPPTSPAQPRRKRQRRAGQEEGEHGAK